ncbi:LPS-assembly protein LptD [Propionivibrio limicola]|uniref:LPS-assembly protein LptD n=1 Tax=Propionivibrio limicola TaxID=167645 RepID=UPI001291171B|nr:LPS-assembly protein LptD [Propionivibrio limicola]
MNLPVRRKPLALFFFYGFASALLGSFADPSFAQPAVPLRVDPALLGLPPLKAATPEKASAVTVKPVEPGVVEMRPVPSDVQAAPRERPSRPEAPRKDAAPDNRASSQQIPARTVVAPPKSPEAAPVAPAVPVTAQAVAVVASVPVVRDGDPEPAISLRGSSNLSPLPKEGEEPRPVFINAQRMNGIVDREFVAEGDAELRKAGTVVTSDKMTYWPIDDEVEAVGNARLEQEGNVVTGPKMRMRLEEQVGYFEEPSYTIKRLGAVGSPSAEQALADRLSMPHSLDSRDAETNDFWSSGFAAPQSVFTDLTKRQQTMTEGRGMADRIDFEGENQIRMTNASYTTCAPGNDDWYAKARDLKLDYDHEVGEGKDGTVYFMDTPIFYTPWLSFSLNNQRKSGFLRPTIGLNSDNGFEYAQPYYWNIAPNMDATITPRLMTKRGVQLSNEFRYLNTAYGGSYSGIFQAEVLPNDREEDGENRYGFFLRHKQTTANGFTGEINYNKVSDDTYLTDLSSRIGSSSQTQLLQQGTLTYGGGGWWNSTINFQQYQTLQPDSETTVLEQYRMLPQITFNARKPDYNLADLSFLGQYTVFTKQEQWVNGAKVSDPDGDRLVLYPQLALPYVTPGWYVTPKVGVNYRHYSLTNQASSIADTQSVTLPIFSIDSAMTFERGSNWFGRDYTQTLEPRLYYVYIPYKDQSQIPIFDSAQADFNFAQIFSENQFSGWDRINDANQITAALTSRLIEPASGNEIVRAMIGQRFYFTKPRVGLTSVLTTDEENWDRSDFLAAFSGQILPRIFADTALQYSPSDSEFQRYSLGVRYQPEPGKALNAAYRYNADSSAPVNQVDFSGQWPINGRWYGVGRLNYSFKDDGTVLSSGSDSGRIIESIAGLEYNGGCWVLRTVVRRQALTSSDASTSFFVQLELNDFSRIGSNPVNLLKRSIQGYGLINQTGADPFFGE